MAVLCLYKCPSLTDLFAIPLFTLPAEFQGSIGIPGVAGFPGGPGLKVRFIFYRFSFRSSDLRKPFNFSFFPCGFRGRLDPRVSEELQDGRETEGMRVLWDHLDHLECR